MKVGSITRRLAHSFKNSAGTVVFGMEDGTVSIFGLIFGVAATTSDPKTVLIAGASGAAAAAVSMMAGAYLDVETTRDEANTARAASRAGAAQSIAERLAKIGLTSEQSVALAAAVKDNAAATGGLLLALDGEGKAPLNPLEQALWMLFADFLAAAVPILPFVFLPILEARIVSGIVTVALLIGLGIGRSRIAKGSLLRTVAETVSMGIAAALAGVGISILIDRLFT